MKKIRVRCQASQYDILIGRNLIGRVRSFVAKRSRGTKVLIVSNRKVAKLFLRPLKQSLRRAGYRVFEYVSPYGNERDKSERVLSSVWGAMAKIPLERGSLVVALGGGVIGDLTGFAAATYMRGVSVLQVPTTLLAQVDSAIGGKTAIDLPAAKNIIGAFHQPEAVVSDILALKTLTASRQGRSHLRDSFAEVIKYGVIADTALFGLLEKNGVKVFKNLKKGKFGSSEIRFLESVVWRSAKVKARVVAEDEFERKGKRVMLNFGHTFAHGFEAGSNYKLSHGAAVAIGMACAARLAVQMKLFKASQEKRLLHLIRAFELPASIQGQCINITKAMRAMQRDKKKQSGRLRFVLPAKIGKTVVRDGIPASQIRKAIRDSGSAA